MPTRMATELADTRWVCRSDALLMTWSLAHQARWLAGQVGSFADGGIYHPASGTLFLGEAGFAALPYFAPVFLLTGNPILAMNLTFFGCIVLTAAALHLVGWWWTGSHASGFVAAWTFLTTRWVLWRWLPVVQTYVVLQYLPLIVLCAAASFRRTWQAVALGTLVALQSLASAYVAVSVVIPLGVLGVLRAIRSSTRRAGLLTLAATAGGALAALPAYLGYAWLRADDPDLPGRSYWTHPQATPTLWRLLDPDAPTGVALGVLVLIMLGVTARLLRPAAADARRHAWRHAWLWTTVGVAISLPPAVRVLGARVPLPQALLAWLTPFYQVIREPERLGVAALVGIALLAALSAAELAASTPASARRATAMLIASLFAGVTWVQYAHGWLTPARLALLPLPNRYPTAAPPDEPDVGGLVARLGGPVLELPVGRAMDPLNSVLHARAMYRQIAHRQRLVNGYHGYWPRGFPERMALAERLPDPDALTALYAATGVRTVVVRPREFGVVERRACRNLEAVTHSSLTCGADTDPGRAERAAWTRLAERGGRDDLRLAARIRDVLIFRVELPGR